MTIKPKFSIIIPNFNGAHFLEDCLNSLLTSLQKVDGLVWEVIFVDNGSKDNSLQIISSVFDKTHSDYCIIQNNSNLGFAKAVNQGINKSKYDWTILLNNDVTLDNNWFSIITTEVQQISDSKIATVFGTVLNKTGDKIESTGLKFYYSGKAENINNQNIYIAPQKKPEFVWGASAALVVYNKNILTQIGMFDEDFFAYEEDVDIALRLHNLNFKTLYVPNAICRHLGGGTSNKMGNFRNRMDSKNWIYIILKNYTKEDIKKYFPKLIEERLRNLSGLIKSTIRQYKMKSLYVLPWSLVVTYGEVLIKLPNMINKRHLIKKLILNKT